MYSLSEIRKALVPAGIALVLALIGSFGITEEMTVGEAVSFAVTAVLVFLIPNKKLQ